MDAKLFGRLPDGRQAYLYRIGNGNLEATVTDFGATLVSLLVPDRYGNKDDVVLGFDNAADYAASTLFFGATVGRNANRIAGGSYTLNDTAYTMEKNNNGNNLHSGSNSYAFRLWDIAEHTPTSISLTLESPDGDQGFPGNASIQVTYSLDQDDTLRITYKATCDADTIFNMTNHTYFNLAGHTKPQMAMEQVLFIPSDTFLWVDEHAIPTGQIQKVEGTPLDFRNPKKLSDDLNADDIQMKLMGGYDHCYVVNHVPSAILSDPNSGRIMQVVTDCPGLQLYTANQVQVFGKEGVYYDDRSAVCLETQYYPDAVNHSQWPQPIVKAGETYCSETHYIFGTIQ